MLLSIKQSLDLYKYNWSASKEYKATESQLEEIQGTILGQTGNWSFLLKVKADENSC